MEEGWDKTHHHLRSFLCLSLPSLAFTSSTLSCLPFSPPEGHFGGSSFLNIKILDTVPKGLQLLLLHWRKIQSQGLRNTLPWYIFLAKVQFYSLAFWRSTFSVISTEYGELYALCPIQRVRSRGIAHINCCDRILHEEQWQIFFKNLINVGIHIRTSSFTKCTT